MARPTKTGLDYFPLDVDMAQDDKVFYIETKHGPTGFSVIVRLLMRIYKNSYYCKWGEKEQLMFSRKVNVDINTLLEIVNDCINEGLFNKEVYEKHQVLTSSGIQNRFLEACSRRKKVEIDVRYLVTNVENYSNVVIVNNNVESEGVNVDINDKSEEVNEEKSTQSKVKKSKVKKSKETSSSSGEKINKSKDEISTSSEGDLEIDTDLSEVAREYERCRFGDITFKIKELLEDMLKQYSKEWIFKAFEIAVEKNKRSLSYVKGILENWKRDGGIKLKKDKSNNNNSGSSPPIKTRFHNFEQRTSKYTAEELERMVRGK